ncbi:MFS transporter [Pseudooceanicola sediminis]|uniref:MFS transporter n=1 Tax=Pseudooceanicola sediminis TaxID=2211117 RepID=A0A399J320_9RHOB|nr:MFS transporter [Pseudooceanicola sediminis]KAA2317306.1 MFS transporter [Puniceibacterium sp. HSS470]RII39660.1 MFS transporter [Pseudooceanicola sediminis]
MYILSQRRQIAIAFVVACAFLMQGIDSTLLTIAIPTIADDLGRAPLSLHVLITAYLLSLAVFMPVSGWFADRFGARRVFCGAIGVFMAASVLCALMPELWMMVPFRLIQGFGGALMTPVGRMIVLRAFGRGRTLDAMTWLTIPVLIGPLIGPLIGAALVEMAHWRLLFLVNLPICAAAIAGALRLIEPEAPVGAQRFDLGGFALAGLSLAMFQLGIEALGHPRYGPLGAVCLASAGVAIFAVYRRHSRRLTAPALDLSLFSQRAFATGVIAGGIGRIGLNSMAFLTPLILQLGLGFRPITAGLLSAMAALGSFASKPLLRGMLARHGFRAVMIALTLTGSASVALFALIGPDWPLFPLLALCVVSGTIRTLYFNAANTLTYTALSEHQLSSAVSSAGVFQQLAMGLGISLSAALLSLLQGASPQMTLSDFHAAFALMALIPLLSLPVLWRLGRCDSQPSLSRDQAAQAGPDHPARPGLRKSQAARRNKSIGAPPGLTKAEDNAAHRPTVAERL